ncbi:MAG: nucleotidyltransferase domain-containing protein [Candidatus Schekmanbacteria bacterium]|nr:nucleotidyltransferase domain-containing protein [Candidatus Schekmanbacteria bacterium]
MNEVERTILGKFKSLIMKKINLYKMILFGSRARGDAFAFSDMDVMIIINNSVSENELDYISDCAWEAGFEYGIVVVPVVFSRDEWENSPERYSLLAQAIVTDGVQL